MNKPLPPLPPDLRKHSKQGKKRDKAQTNSPLSSILPTTGLTNPSIPASLNAADQPPSAPPIGHARRGGGKYVPSHPNPSTSISEPTLEHQPVPAPNLTHGPSSIGNAFQGGNRSLPPRLNPAASRALAPSGHGLNPGNSSRQPSVAQISTALQGINISTLPRSNLVTPRAFPPRNCRSVPDNPIHQLLSTTPTIARSQGTTEYILRPSLINISDLSRPPDWSAAIYAS